MRYSFRYQYQHNISLLLKVSSFQQHLILIVRFSAFGTIKETDIPLKQWLLTCPHPGLGIIQILCSFKLFQEKKFPSSCCKSFLQCCSPLLYNHRILQERWSSELIPTQKGILSLLVVLEIMLTDGFLL